MDYQWFLDQLRAHKPFTFSRWGDGEWLALLGKNKGANCDGHPYSDDLAEALRSVLRSRPKYVLGLQPLTKRLPGLWQRVQDWLRTENLQFEWCNSDIFHEQSIQGNLKPLVDELSQHRLVVVGPNHLRKLPLFSKAIFITVPVKGAWQAGERLLEETLAAIGGQSYSVVSVSAGMTAEVLLHSLHDRCPDHALIDFGSIWDPYVGVKSRRYMRDPNKKFSI